MAATLHTEGRAATGDAIFVGRARELAAFRDVFELMITGRRQILTLAGEPGIGKTRLAEAIAETAEGRGALVLWGRCYEEPGAPPYWPWVQILRDFVAGAAPSEIRRMAGEGGAQIASLVPELSAVLGTPEARDETPLEPGETRFRTFDAIARFVRRAADQVPLVLIVDNAHWADEASLALLEFLSQELVQSQLLVVCTYRDTEVSRHKPLYSTLGELSRGAGIERLKLGGLDRAAIELLAGHLLGKELPAPVITAIDQQTDGNPLFVIELLKVFIDESRDVGIEPIAVRIPDGVRETIGRRLSRLPNAVNELLRMASVLGRSFDARELAQIADVDIGTVLAGLHLAEIAGFVESRDDMPQAYRFTHALMRETLYDEIPTPERLRLHGAAGDALVSMDPAHEPMRLSQIAHHYFESAALGNASKAADYAERAGHAAMRLDAYEEAVIQFGNVMSLLQQQGRADSAAFRRALFRKSRALLGTGDLDSASELLVGALGDGDSFDDAEWLVDAVTQWIILRSGSIQAEQLPVLRRIMGLLPKGDSSARAKALAAQAFVERTLGSMSRIRALVEESIAMARRLEDLAILRRCFQLAFFALNGDPTTLELRLALGAEFLRASPAGDHSEGLAEAAYQQCLNFIEAGKLDELDRLLDEYERVKAGRMGLHEHRTRAFRIVSLLLRGEYAGLEARIEALRVIGHKTRGEDAEGVYGSQMFALYRDLGKLEQFAPAIERFASAPPSRAWGPGLMLALTEIGRLDGARRELERFAVDGFSAIPKDDLRVTSLVFCSETCAALGDSHRARQLYDLLLPYAGTFASHPTAVCFGSIELYLGILAATMNDLDIARRHFDAALRENSTARAWPWLARTCYRYALALKTSGRANDQTRANELLHEAEQSAGSLGMAGLASDINRLLKGHEGSEDFPDALTAREVDVLRLLAIGRSNKDIAKVLSISLNTVATHVRNILMKTDCANRTEAAAYAARNELIESH